MEVLPDALLDDLADRIVARLAARMRSAVSVGPDASPGDAPCSSASEWLTVTDAARYLGMKPKALYCAVARRQVPASRLDRRLRFNRVGLDALLRGRAGKMPPACPVAGKDS